MTKPLPVSSELLGV